MIRRRRQHRFVLRLGPGELPGSEKRLGVDIAGREIIRLKLQRTTKGDNRLIMLPRRAQHRAHGRVRGSEAGVHCDSRPALLNRLGIPLQLLKNDRRVDAIGGIGGINLDGPLQQSQCFRRVA